MMETKDIPADIPRVPLFIDGGFVESQAETWFPVHDPSTNRLLSVVPQSTNEEVDRAIASAHHAFQTWRHTSLIKRQQCMFELTRLIRQNMVPS